MKLGKGAFVKNAYLRNGFRVLYCFDMDGPKGRVCWRAMDHSGRHADIGDHGEVRGVWGTDTLGWRRIASRQRAAQVRYNHGGVVITLTQARTWDGVAL